MAQAPRTRKSPERVPPRKGRPVKAEAPAIRLLKATAAAIGRHPRLLGGLASFGVIFSFVAANALWYQPRHHPAPLLATRMFDDAPTRALANVAVPAEDPGVTTFRIERESEEAAAEQAVLRPEASPLVRDIQMALARRGLYDGPADGLAGPRTEAAILFFEQTEGMEETGEASEALLERIGSLSGEVAEAIDETEDMTTSSTARAQTDEVAALIASSEAKSSDAVFSVIPEPKPVSPALVMQIQKALTGMAYANIKVDGIAGEATRTAIRAFEKNYRLPVTGEPSERVLEKLKAIGAI